MSDQLIKPQKDHYDVAVVGVWFGANYGSVLNGYTVYKLLKDKGLSVLMINKINALPNDGEIHGTHNGDFVDRFYPKEDISPCFPFEELSQLNDYCDTFVTGSDQIWHYNVNSYFNMAMMLNFVDEKKRKISFGTSFGHSVDFTPPEHRDEAIRLMNRFNAISVREKTGVDLCRRIYKVKARTIIEPVFCVKRKVFDDLALKSDICVSSPYILSYILDPSPELREIIQYYEDITGKKSIIILDGQPSTYNRNKELLNLPNMLTGIGAHDFLYLFQNADFIITDSFHGTAFSIIYNKRFISVANKKRGYSRFEDLLSRFELFDRLVYDAERFGKSERFLDEIDYSLINKEIEVAKKDALDWLDYALFTPINDFKSNKYPLKAITNELEKENCVGCGACISVCPKDALRLVLDELGYYRADINLDKCIDCGACTSICPAYKLPKKNNEISPACYVYQAKDEEILENSSSGGAFSALANIMFKNGGKVCGVSWTNDFKAKHIIISAPNELYLLRKSKYMQSYVGYIFRDIKQLLDDNVKVLFSGCPCQVAGLRSFLKKNYENLLLVDLLCGNSPSTAFFQEYLKETFPLGISEYTFRYKNRDNNWNPGWRGDVVLAVSNNGERKIIRGGKDDSFQRVYHNHTMCPAHCEKCQFQEVPRYGDITIGDFWGYERFADDVDIKKGVSVVLCNNKKGEQFFNSIDNKDIGYKNKVSFEWISGNGYAKKGTHNYASEHRNAFYEAFRKMPFSEAVNYALKPNKGLYRKTYKGSLDALQYDKKQLRFTFEKDIWEELYIDGTDYLMVKNPMEKPGHFATLPLNNKLKKGEQYKLDIKFRIRTIAPLLNLHIKDSGSRLYQLIDSVQLKNRSDGGTWIERNIIFTPDTDYYDEFMIGAAQLSGVGNYITFEYIHISIK